MNTPSGTGSIMQCKNNQKHTNYDYCNNQATRKLVYDLSTVWLELTTTHRMIHETESKVDSNIRNMEELKHESAKIIQEPLLTNKNMKKASLSRSNGLSEKNVCLNTDTVA